MSLPPRVRLAPIDGLMMLLALIWGSNFSVVKTAIVELPPHGFNTLRLLLASVLFSCVMILRGELRLERRDLGGILGLALTGHLLYQLCFMSGLARTSVANSALILGSGPVAVALLTAALGYERITTWHWLGVALSLGGLYLVVGGGAGPGGTGTGDLLTAGAVLCWTVYTVAARPLLTRYSPLVVTGYSLVFGAVMYVPFGLADLGHLDWAAVSPRAWVGLGYSAVFAICVAYLIWYTAVQRIGGARTSIYAYVVPVVAMVVAAMWLAEPIGLRKIVGTMAVLGGIAVTKLGTSTPVPLPPEE